MTAADTVPADGLDTSAPGRDVTDRRSRGRRASRAGTIATGERVSRHRIRSPRGRVGLRRRILLVFTLGSLGLSAFLAVTSYGLVRSNLIEQRESSSRDAAYTHAQVVQTALRGGPRSAEPTSERLRELGVQAPLIRYEDNWSAGVGLYGPAAIPAPLRDAVLVDAEDSWMITDVGDRSVIVFGIPLPELGAYFEFFELADDEQTLSNVALSLLLAGVITTALGVLLGVFAARRAVRPVAEAAQAAKAIAGGHFETRLTPTSDPDLGVLATSFNDMASALQLRIDRDARFASDVSHELRSPLMTLSASVEVMEARRDELPERAQAALDLLTSDVARFQGLVEDLLEISRFDAGAIRLNVEDLPIAEFVRNAVAVSSAPSTPVTVTPRAERAVIRGDRRRLARVVANLIDNARAYGGGDPQIAVVDADLFDEPLTHVQIRVEDQGPGVPVEERALIFERFARGATAGRRAGSEGAGLGLALVDEHVRMHGGRVWVDDRLDGGPGASFVIELAAVEPAAAAATEEFA
ncbi:MAG: HAMP domain-containing sensor histidine kinase [Ilumatobacteraceae bacterium]